MSTLIELAKKERDELKLRAAGLRNDAKRWIEEANNAALTASKLEVRIQVLDALIWDVPLRTNQPYSMGNTD